MTDRVKMSVIFDDMNDHVCFLLLSSPSINHFIGQPRKCSIWKVSWAQLSSWRQICALATILLVKQKEMSEKNLKWFSSLSVVIDLSHTISPFVGNLKSVHSMISPCTLLLNFYLLSSSLSLWIIELATSFCLMWLSSSLAKT